MNPTCREAGETYTCRGCHEPRCRDCQPSPGEADDLCGDCYWVEDPEAVVS